MPEGSPPADRAPGRTGSAASEHRPGDDLRRYLAFEVRAGRLRPHEVSVLDHHLAAQDRGHRPGVDVMPLPGRVVGLV